MLRIVQLIMKGFNSVRYLTCQMKLSVGQNRIELVKFPFYLFPKYPLELIKNSIIDHLAVVNCDSRRISV